MTLQRDLAWQYIDAHNRASVAHQLARYALAIDFSLLPGSVVHQAKRCVLDALGCAIGAYEAPGRVMCEETVRALGGAPEATVFCSGLRTSALNASLVNSFLVRFLDYNDLGGGGHNSDCLASILAVAERARSSGRDFLTALVISYEIGARFEAALTKPLDDIGGVSKEMRAGLNQPPALGKLMQLTEEQIASAIGLCMSHTLPLKMIDADREENVMAKNIGFGWAAHDALLACMLAQRGFTGPVRVMESESAGVRKFMLHGEMDFERLLDFSGWRILHVRHKALCANGTTHGHIYATLQIVKEHDLKPRDIAAVHIRASARECRHTTTPAKKYPRNAESADHSAYYANAVAIKERAFGPDSIRPEKFTDPVILDLIEKITVEPDPAFARYQASSEILTTDGRRFQCRVDNPHGVGGDKVSDKELEEKFSEMACRHMDDAHIRRLFDACWNAEQLDDIGQLAKLMVFPSSRA